MNALSYTVTATLPDESTAAEYVAWLLDGHIQGVVDGGATSASVVRLRQPDDAIRVETRYLFANRSEYDRYVAEFAPALREDGLARFGPNRGVTFGRTVGEVIG